MARKVPGTGRPAKHAAHVQDGASPALFEKLAHGGAIGIKKTGEVQIERELPAFIRHLMQRTISLRAAAPTRHMVERIEPAKLPHRDLNRSFTRCRLTRIRRESARARTKFPHGLARLLLLSSED